MKFSQKVDISLKKGKLSAKVRNTCIVLVAAPIVIAVISAIVKLLAK